MKEKEGHVFKNVSLTVKSGARGDHGEVALEKQRCARFWQDICSRAAARCFWMENRFPKGLSSGADDMAASGKAVNPRLRLRDTLSDGVEVEERIIRGLGIEPDWMNRYPGELSGGELQRFCIARALGKTHPFSHCG